MSIHNPTCNDCSQLLTIDLCPSRGNAPGRLDAAMLGRSVSNLEHDSCCAGALKSETQPLANRAQPTRRQTLAHRCRCLRPALESASIGRSPPNEAGLIFKCKCFRWEFIAELVWHHWLRSQEWSAFLLPGPIPQSEFNPVANANLLVDRGQIVSDRQCSNPEFSGDFLVSSSLRHEL